jgi:hypothetical protein
MNNRVQQRFDASIKKAIADVKRAKELRRSQASAVPVICRPVETPQRTGEPRGRLVLNPHTGGTEFLPEGSDALAKWESARPQETPNA